MYRKRTITAIIPALNEEASIGSVINELSALGVCAQCGFTGERHSQKYNNFLTENSVDVYCNSCLSNTNRVPLIDNIVMCDNGSTDNTAAIARSYGAMVIEELEQGYGAACLAAMRFPLEKDLVVFVDGDYSVVCAEMPKLLDPLFSGADLVIGSRTLGVCESGALSVPQILGNRLASALMRLFWKKRVTDLGPFRAVSNQVFNELQMQDRQFGWTVEMQVRALQLNKQVVEIPVTTRKRIGQSKIGGTVSGVIGASKGILGTIAKLYWRDLSARYGRSFSVKAINCQMAETRAKRKTL